MSSAWHKHRTKDPGLTWLRQLLHRAVLRMNQVALSAAEAAKATAQGVAHHPSA